MDSNSTAEEAGPADAKKINGGGGNGNKVLSIPINGSLDGRTNVTKEPIPMDELPPEIQKIIQSRQSSKSRERQPLEVIEGKHILTMILYLDKMSPVLKSDVYRDVSRSSRMADKLADLQSLGIIQIYQTARTISNVIIMTDKGKQMAAKIREMVDIIES